MSSELDMTSLLKEITLTDTDQRLDTNTIRARRSSLNPRDPDAKAENHDAGRVKRTFMNQANERIFFGEEEQVGGEGIGNHVVRQKTNREQPVDNAEYFSYLGEFLAVTHPEVFNVNGKTLEELVAASKEKMSALKKGTRLQLYCVDISETGKIHCVWDHDYGVMAAIRKEIEKTNSSESFLDRESVTSGTLVLAPLGKRAEYGRAKIVGFPMYDQVEMEFLDFGIVCSVSRNELRQMPPKLKNIPGLAKRCEQTSVIPKTISLSYMKLLRKSMEGFELSFALSKISQKGNVKVYGGIFEFIGAGYNLTKEMIKSGLVQASNANA